MDCWEVLGIDPDSDKKTIKIAYAKLLKIHRPDEDPEGFQLLHTAYKNALQWVPVDYPQDNTPWMTDEGKPIYEIADAFEPSHPSTSDRVQYPDDVWSEEAPALVLSPEDEALLTEINEQEESLSKDWGTLYTRVNEIVKSPGQANDLASWQFIEALPSMHDLEFRKATADKMFEVVAELNEASLEQKNLYIKRPVINYLNGLFGWDVKWQQYEYHYTRTMLDAVFPYLEEADRPVKGVSKDREISYYRRIAAFAIDIVILVLVAFIINPFTANSGEEDGVLTTMIWWGVFYVLLLIPLQESSRHKGTIGKRVMGLQVISAKGRRLSFFHALWRSIVTMQCCLWFKFVVFINMFLLWWRRELLQDMLSRSYVTLKSVP